MIRTVLSRGRRFFSLSSCSLEKYSCKVLVAGGGAGGCALGSKLSWITKKTELIVLDPADYHFYQGFFTLCGAGIKKVCDAARPMRSVLPKNSVWIQSEAAEFCPERNTVITCEGDEIEYDILVLAIGTSIAWRRIPGLIEALENYDNVGTIFSPRYAEKTYNALQHFKGGNVVFTYPRALIKCAGAPLKICFLLEDILRLRGMRNESKIVYHTPYPTLFAVKEYDKTLVDIASRRNIDVNYMSILIEVRPEKNEVVFKHRITNDRIVQEYSILHVTPPMGPADALKKCRSLVNKYGYVDVDKHTMQHVRYPNIFAIGDCSSTPNAKTAASCAAQAPVIFDNIKSFLSGKDCKASYDGYSSCPIVTAVGKCILAEFDYEFIPKETFPFSQNRELWISYIMKKEMMPRLYWYLMMRGHWNGPYLMRKLLHLGFGG